MLPFDGAFFAEEEIIQIKENREDYFGDANEQDTTRSGGKGILVLEEPHSEIGGHIAENESQGAHEDRTPDTWSDPFGAFIEADEVGNDFREKNRGTEQGRIGAEIGEPIPGVARGGLETHEEIAIENTDAEKQETIEEGRDAIAYNHTAIFSPFSALFQERIIRGHENHFAFAR